MSSDDLAKWVSKLCGKLSWNEICCLLSAGLLGKLLWNQYGALCHEDVPQSDLGLPFLGHTLSIFRESLEGWGQRLIEGKPVLLTNFLFANVCMVSYPVYLKSLHRAELDGQFKTGGLPAIEKILGKNSVLLLPAGKGHLHHKRLRAKLLRSLGPRPVLELLPDVASLIRTMLDGLAAETARNGMARFEEPAAQLASRASTLMVTAGLDSNLQARLESLLDDVAKGVLGVPLDLGRFSTFGRAMIARREVATIIKTLMESPNLERRNIIADLMKPSEDDEAFSCEEIVDTVFTLLVAGKLTTADSLPVLLVRLHEHRKWAQRVAQEGLDLANPEEDSVTLRVVREALRLKPPLGAYRRITVDPLASVDLGEHGRVPPGCPFAVFFGPALAAMGSDFNPDRWTPEAVKDQFLVFGGSQPHACIGKSLALLELQLFARILCREYDFEALSTELVVVAANPLATRYKDGLRVRVWKRPA